MAGMLELPDSEYKTTMNSMIKALLSKAESMQIYMNNVSREKAILRKK